MILFENLSDQKPFQAIKKSYEKAFNAGQKNIEAISISSYSTTLDQINARFVNLKIIDNNEFIFFTNYNSPKANEFDQFNQIAASLFWSSINTQIRIKAKIKKTSYEFNQKYFYSRSHEKNALAISSNQSKPISSYKKIKENFNKSLQTDDLKKCPNYWGGYAFEPFEIELWEGNEYRLNRRNLYKLDNDLWNHFILEP